MTQCPSEYVLVQLVCEDLITDQAKQVRSHLTECGACQKKLKEIETAQSAFGLKKTAHWNRLEPKLLALGEDKPKSGWIFPIPRLAFAALGAVSVLLLVFLVVSLEPQTTGQQYKGDVAVRVVAKRMDRQFVVKPQQQLQMDDALRFVITTPSPVYVSVFSVSAQGVISAFYPDSPASNAPGPMYLDRPGRHELPGSIVLDDSLGSEWFVVMLSPKRFGRDKWHPKVGQALKEQRSIEKLAGLLGFDGSLFVLPILKVKGQT